MNEDFPFKSYCWCLGTTSFRTKNFNLRIEKQLELLSEFWSQPEYCNKEWNNMQQEAYYYFMLKKDFVSGDAPNPAKDAREKTSGLVDIGLIDNNRRLTNVGIILLEISDSGIFSSDNDFFIPKDSYIYLKQLLKTYDNINGINAVRPFIVFLYVLSKVDDYLSNDEFTYLLPFCIDNRSTEQIISSILSIRNAQSAIDDTILSMLFLKQNYQDAKQYFLNNEVNVDNICAVGMNRKSHTYDKPYFELFNKLYVACSNRNDANIIELYNYIQEKITLKKWWINYLFDNNESRIIDHFTPKIFECFNNENYFKSAFFNIMHLFKAKATLNDYQDLNKRYIKTSDIVLFYDGIVKLDIIPYYFFREKIDNIYELAYTECDQLFNNVIINEIHPALIFEQENIIRGVSEQLGVEISNMHEAHEAFEDERYKRFNLLIDTKFTDKILIELLKEFKERKDTSISNKVTNNADIPTIFEYILGVIWYKLSDRRGKILDYLNLSLEADLLPKTHAGGGVADIIYLYEECNDYPEHSLLLEATLCVNTHQRRMEMEPVSRHLGDYLLNNPDKNAYCIFISTYLQPNVIADFRGRKNSPYFNSDCTNQVDSMNIILFDTDMLIELIQKNKKYSEIYTLCQNAYNTEETNPIIWHERLVKNPIFDIQ